MWNRVSLLLSTCPLAVVVFATVAGWVVVVFFFFTEIIIPYFSLLLSALMYHIFFSRPEPHCTHRQTNAETLLLQQAP